MIAVDTKEKRRAYYQANKEKVRRYYLEHRADRIAYAKKYQQERSKKDPAFRSMKKRKSRLYYSQHSERMVNMNKLRVASRLLTDSAFRWRSRASTKLRSCIESIAKGNVTYPLCIAALIGCTKPELKAWFEKHFSHRMSWENIWAWEIDHVVPCRAFDLSDPVERKQCYHFTNLRPVWARWNTASAKHLKRNFLTDDRTEEMRPIEDEAQLAEG